MRTVVTIILTGTALYGAFAIFVYLMQSRLLFLPDMPGREIAVTPRDVGLHYEQLQIRTEDSETLDAWFIPAENSTMTLLFFHGNAGNISHRLDSIHIFSAMSLNVFILDYRGYGRSSGKPSEHGTYRDAQAAWQYLTEARTIQPQNIVIFGRSLGAAIAAWLATQVTPKALILESAFTSVPDMAVRLYPFLPVRWMARLRYPTKEYLAAVSCPVLVIHSRDDEIIPFENGQQLFDAAREPKRFLELRGGHNDGFLVSKRAYSQGIRAFLDEADTHNSKKLLKKPKDGTIQR